MAGLAWVVSDAVKTFLAMLQLLNGIRFLWQKGSRNVFRMRCMTIAAAALMGIVFVGAHNPEFMGWQTHLFCSSLVAALEITMTYNFVLIMATASYSTTKLRHSVPALVRFMVYSGIILMNFLVAIATVGALVTDQQVWTGLILIAIPVTLLPGASYGIWCMSKLRNTMVEVAKSLSRRRSSYSRKHSCSRKQDSKIDNGGEPREHSVSRGTPNFNLQLASHRARTKSAQLSQNNTLDREINRMMSLNSSQFAPVSDVELKTVNDLGTFSTSIHIQNVPGSYDSQRDRIPKDVGITKTASNIDRNELGQERRSESPVVIKRSESPVVTKRKQQNLSPCYNSKHKRSLSCQVNKSPRDDRKRTSRSPSVSRLRQTRVRVSMSAVEMRAMHQIERERLDENTRIKILRLMLAALFLIPTVSAASIYILLSQGFDSGTLYSRNFKQAAKSYSWEFDVMSAAALLGNAYFHYYATHHHRNYHTNGEIKRRALSNLLFGSKSFQLQ
eukprot:CAMPEP_0114505754 /NCGR_PEP_ID=MMETSP0109-20121206/11029_1 /TAXON_ID=29199 /ORGANISM="Chlorarachnion reptans, Strain CCCM449" /LENGTH=500 /DNA_ID=CAMNT_0001684229 /DNA_START=26 /DNA_END=1528 /DNA_ORIENTATION=-